MDRWVNDWRRTSRWAHGGCHSPAPSAGKWGIMVTRVTVTRVGCRAQRVHNCLSSTDPEHPSLFLGDARVSARRGAPWPGWTPGGQAGQAGPRAGPAVSSTTPHAPHHLPALGRLPGNAWAQQRRARPPMADPPGPSALPAHMSARIAAQHVLPLLWRVARHSLSSFTSRHQGRAGGFTLCRRGM